jgi:thiol-disulfide isomerase/thioredoxin
MSIKQVEFTNLEKQTAKTKKNVLDLLAPKVGSACAIAISRDNCPACKKQKPKLDKLARELVKKHGDKVVFTRIHVKQPAENNSESLRAKDLLHHYFYPTNLIVLRTADRGAIEYYRISSPPMAEFKRNIEAALETAAALAMQR